MSKIINSLSGLNLTVPINGGSCSKIYKVSPDEYFKLLNEDYRDLAEPENIEVLETLLELQKVKTPSLATPITIYCNKDSLFGYTSKIMHGIFTKKRFKRYKTRNKRISQTMYKNRRYWWRQYYVIRPHEYNRLRIKSSC